jgi:crotonobetainyl-CoA:carnitine CoA-transferase CaiB-like acyl-CoA transferase
VVHRTDLVPLISSHTQKLSTAELMERTRRHSVPSSPIQNVAQVVEDEQVAATELLTPAPRPGAENYRDLSIPLRIDDLRPRGTLAAPRMGEHTVAILEELGYSEAERTRLFADGVAEAGRDSEAGD